MTAAKSATAPPLRRWLQFSLRSLLVIVVPVACLMALIGTELDKARRDKQTIAWVEEMGGSIEYDDFVTQNDWRRSWFGEWFPGSVKTISLKPPVRRFFVRPNGAVFEYDPSPVVHIEPLAELNTLQELNLSGTQVSNLTPLAGLGYLRGLELRDTQVSDLAPLAKLENLERLGLSGTQVSDLTPLAELKNLQLLDLTYTDISVQHIQALQQLLPDCQIAF